MLATIIRFANRHSPGMANGATWMYSCVFANLTIAAGIYLAWDFLFISALQRHRIELDCDEMHHALI